LRLTKLDNTLDTYIHGYYRVLSYSKKTSHNDCLVALCLHTGVEVQYDLYNPTIIRLEVLKLEKRLDDELLYLRDAPQEYSTVPFDMEPVVLPPGIAVPINTMKVGQTR